MINLFGLETVDEYLPNLQTGLVYTDSEYDISFESIRKAGVLPNKAISALLINTALKQCCALSYVLVNSIKSIMQYCYSIPSSLFDDLDSSKIVTILGSTTLSSTFIYYLNHINNIISGSDKVNTVYNYDTTSTGISSINSKFIDLNTTISNKESSISTSIINAKTSIENDTTVAYICKTYFNGTSQIALANTFDTIETQLNQNGFYAI